MTHFRYDPPFSPFGAGYLGTPFASLVSMDFPVRFSRYLLREKIAQGGMAEVFRAEQLGEEGFTKPVAIKRLLPGWSENEVLTGMLIDEAKALVQLNHPNIVQVFELGRVEGRFFISMEWVEGVDLRECLDNAAAKGVRLSITESLYIMEEVLKGLDYAHRKEGLELIHRDISPQNILLANSGEVKLTDFGIAKGKHRQIETTQHQVKGKYAYMSPEQALGLSLTQASDLFSCGTLLYEMLTGEQLFGSENDLMTLERVKGAVLPEKKLSALPVALQEILRKALAKDLRRRYGSAREFLENLHTVAKFFSEGGAATPSVDSKPRALVSLFKIAAVLLMGIVFGGISWDYFHSSAGQLIAATAMGPQNAVTPVSATPVSRGSSSSTSIPKSVGTLTIRTIPSRKEGQLIFRGKTETIVTPYFLGDLPLDAAMDGEVVFVADGKTIRESLRVDSKHPNLVKTLTLPVENKNGTLRISARPWGLVTIPGHLQDRETPISAFPLPEGSYSLTLQYPPKNLVARTVVSFRKGHSLRCHVDFTTGSELACGPEKK